MEHNGVEIDRAACPVPPPHVDLKAHCEVVPKKHVLHYGEKSAASKLWQQLEVHAAGPWASR